MNWIAHVTILPMSLAALAGDVWASEPSRSDAFPAYLHWSAPKKSVSPDHAWELAVFPIYRDGGNHSPVVVRKRRGGRANLVLTLQRDANFYWGSGSRLLIIDDPITTPRSILLFRLGSTGAVTRLRPTPDLDADIRARVLGALGRTKAVVFYIPTFGSWTGSQLVLRLGGTFVHGTTGPMTSYCYRVTVDSRTAKVESMAKEPAGEHSKCQIFP